MAPVRRCLLVRGSDQAYLKFILEAYEGMATLSCRDSRLGLLELTIPPPFLADIEKLLAELSRVIVVREIIDRAEDAILEENY
jgi:hypothetical protein